MTHSPAVSALHVADEDFLVSSTIERCPKTMMARELVKNALEAAQEAQPGHRRVEFRVSDYGGAPKLTIWNTGPGMSDRELHAMCDIASSIGKVKSLDDNFGMGAKVASLPSNREGMIYRSCKDGRVSELVLCQREGRYGRLCRIVDGEREDVIDVTAIAEDEGEDLSEDWTEVTLLGNSPDQDTVFDTYGGDPPVDKQWLTTYLYHRFYRMPEGVRVQFNPGTHKLRDGVRVFETITGRAQKGVFEKIETVTTDSGINIHYIYDAPYEDTSHNRSVSGAIQSAVSTSAIVFKDEMYDLKSGRAWAMDAPLFGIPFGARHISIHVEMPEGYPVRPDGYRQFLRYQEGEQAQVRVADFAQLVNAHRPKWLIELIRSFAPESQSSDDLRNELQKLLDDLRVKRVMPRADAIGAKPADEHGVGARPTKEGVGVTGAAARPRTRHTDLNIAPEGSRRADLWKDRERAPEIVRLTSDADIEDKQIKGRAARYYESGTLFVNMQYPSIAEMQSALELEYASVADIESMRVAALQNAEESMVLRVGRAVVFALAKQLNKEWDAEHVKKALEPESLSLAADDYYNSMQRARRSIGRLFRPNRQVENEQPEEELEIA